MPFPNRRFTGKTALVTGGSSGIGRAAAVAFAREGAEVVIAARGVERGRSVVEEIESNGGTALFVATDVARGDQVEALFEETRRRFGRLNCAFNNAASVPLSELVRTGELSEEQVDSSLATNLKSVWLCMREELGLMLKQEPAGGAIVNASSINGLGGARNGSLYSAAKAGILAFTKAAALEYARDGIRVNALVAGAFRTPMFEQAVDFFAGGNHELRELIEQRYSSFTALNRIGTPEEAAEAVLWLCSDSSSYVTGSSLIVDGGWTAAMR